MNFQNLLGIDISRVSELPGGSIAKSFQVIDEIGESYFVKEYSHPDLVSQESYNLNMLSSISGIKTPKIIKSAGNFLVLEWIEKESLTEKHWKILADRMALLHSSYCDYFGYSTNNYIGINPQMNFPIPYRKAKDWFEFFWQYRIIYQCDILQKRRPEFREIMEVLIHKESKVEQLLTEVDEAPVLLHGDLWEGNVLASGDEVYFIDPACYWGHREVDFALFNMFGILNPILMKQYNSHKSLSYGFEARVKVYELYHYMNHLNTFGESYFQTTMDTIHAL